MKQTILLLTLLGLSLLAPVAYGDDYARSQKIMDAKGRDDQEKYRPALLADEGKDSEIPEELRKGFKREERRTPPPASKPKENQKHDKYAALKGGLLGASLAMAASTLIVLLSGNSLHDYVMVNFPMLLGSLTFVLLVLWVLAYHYL